MSRYLLIVLLFFTPFSLSVRAQQHVDIASLNYKIQPAANTEDGSTFRESSFAANLLLPVQRENGDAYLTGVNFEQVRFSFPDAGQSQSYSPTRFILGYQRLWDKDQSLTALFLPAVKSDWRNIDSRHLQFGAYLRYDRMISENTKIKLGAYFNTEISGPFFVPLISLDYYGFERWDFYGIFPVNYNILYSVTDRFRAGARYQGLMNSVFTEQNSQPAYWERAPQEFYLSAEFDLSNFLVVRAGIGHTVMRVVSLYNHEDQVDWRLSAVPFGDNRNHDISADDSPVFDLSFIFRYQTGDQN